MPTFEVNAPDGRKFRVNAPQGATQDDAIAYVQNSLYSQKDQSAPSKPVEKLSSADKVAFGAVDPIHGGAQLLTKVLPEKVVKAGNEFNNWLADKTGLVARLPEGGVDQQVRQREADYQAKREAAGESGFDGWRMVGNVLSPANRAIPAGGVGASLGQKVLTGAASGAASAALAPVESEDFWTQKGLQVGSGGFAGGSAPLVSAGLARWVSPNASVNSKVKLLKQEGVKPTIGQTLGGVANSIEEKMQSLPFLGDSIAAARNRAKDQFNQAAINRATAPINAKVEGVGTSAIKEAGDAISDAYSAAKNQLGSFRVDQQANSELSNLRLLAGSGLEGRERSTFNKYFKDYVVGNKGFTPEKFKEFDSKITGDIAKFGQGDAYQQKLSDALKEVQRIVTDNAKRANPKAAKALEDADTAWANLVRVEGAATAAKSSDGVFTPGQLMTAVRSADKSVRDRATARGTALMQDLASAGTSVLGSKVPDSGTAGRLLPVGAGAAAYANPMAAGIGLLGGLTAYSPIGQDALRWLVTTRPEAAKGVANAIRKTSPSLVLPASQVGVGLLR